MEMASGCPVAACQAPAFKTLLLGLSLVDAGSQCSTEAGGACSAALMPSSLGLAQVAPLQGCQPPSKSTIQPSESTSLTPQAPVCTTK